MLAILFVSDALLLFRLLNEYEASDVYVTFNESLVIIRPLPTKKEIYVASPCSQYQCATVWVLRLHDVFSERSSNLGDGSTK